MNLKQIITIGLIGLASVTVSRADLSGWAVYGTPVLGWNFDGDGASGGSVDSGSTATDWIASNKQSVVDAGWSFNAKAYGNTNTFVDTVSGKMIWRTKPAAPGTSEDIRGTRLLGRAVTNGFVELKAASLYTGGSSKSIANQFVLQDSSARTVLNINMLYTNQVRVIYNNGSRVDFSGLNLTTGATFQVLWQKNLSNSTVNVSFWMSTGSVTTQLLNQTTSGVGPVDRIYMRAGNTDADAQLEVDSLRLLALDETSHFRWADPYGKVLSADFVSAAADYGVTNNTGEYFNPAYTNLMTGTQHSAVSGSIAGTQSGLTYFKIDGPDWLTVSTNGAIAGTPDGTVLIYNNWTVGAQDTNGVLYTMTLRMAIENVNDAPVFSANPLVLASINEGASLTAELADYVSDVDLPTDTLTYSKVSGPSWLSVAADGTLSGTPATQDNVGLNSWTVQVSDGSGGVTQNTLQLTVIDVAYAPQFLADPVTAREAVNGVAYHSTLAGAVTDRDNNPLSYSKVSGPDWLTVAADGTLSGTPGTTDTGLNSWTVQADDGTGLSTAATLRINVEATAGIDVVSVTGLGPTKTGTTLLGTVSDFGGLFTDRIPAFPVLSSEPVSTLASDYYGVTVTNLTVGNVSNVTLTFDLRLSLVTNSIVTGLAVRNNLSFGYWVDSNGNSYSRFFNKSAVLTFAVTNVTIDKGLAVPTVSFRADQPWGLYLNNSGEIVSTNQQYAPTWDPATGTLTASSISSTAEGAAVKGLGIDFVFNVAPVAQAQAVTLAEDTATMITLAGSLQAGDELTYQVVTVPAHGSLSGTAPNLLYTPADNYVGADSFSFKVNDGAADSAPATVSLTVTAVNDSPVFALDPVSRGSVVAGNAYSGPGLSGSAVDVEGSAVTYSKLSGPAWLTVAADGTLSGTPGSSDLGQNSWTVQASDGAAAGTATLNILVENPPYSDEVSITGLTPGRGSSMTIIGTASHSGVVTTDRSPSFPVGLLPEGTVKSDYYGVTVTNLTVGGVSNITMTFDLSLSVTNSNGIGVRDSSNFSSSYWVDCDSNNYTRFFNGNAKLTFAVTNVTVNNGFSVSAVSFLTNAPWALANNDGTASTNTLYTPASWNPATGMLTASAANSSAAGAIVKGLGIRFTLNQAPSYTLSYASGGSGTISGATSQTVGSGANGTAVTAVPDHGYTFAGWSDGRIDNPRVDSNVTASVAVTAEFDSIYPVADMAGTQSTAYGTVSGALADSYFSDNTYEVLTEELDGTPTSRLEHQWTLSVYGGELSVFYVEAHHSANTEGDHFVFAWSTNSTDWVDMLTVTKTNDNNSLQYYLLPTELNGTVYIRVKDTDRSANRTALDSLYVDEMFIVSDLPVIAPIQASNPQPAANATGVSKTPVLSWTPGVQAAMHAVYFGTNPVPGSAEFKGSQSGTSYTPGTLTGGKTYYWLINETNSLGTTTGTVWSFTTTP